MKSNLITRSGHDKLVAELQHLWHEERPEITKKVNWAASLGDRSENADHRIITLLYILFKIIFLYFSLILTVDVLISYTITL